MTKSLKKWGSSYCSLIKVFYTEVFNSVQRQQIKILMGGSREKGKNPSNIHTKIRAFLFLGNNVIFKIRLIVNFAQKIRKTDEQILRTFQKDRQID